MLNQGKIELQHAIMDLIIQFMQSFLSIVCFLPDLFSPPPHPSPLPQQQPK
jgi:hypothetical protein